MEDVSTVEIKQSIEKESQLSEDEIQIESIKNDRKNDCTTSINDIDAVEETGEEDEDTYSDVGGAPSRLLREGTRCVESGSSRDASESGEDDDDDNNIADSGCGPCIREDGDRGGDDNPRQSGDGQESISPKKVDDDEDKKNPQYIPKKGTFYEHDDRGGQEENNKTAENDAKEEDIPENETKKKIWLEEKSRWNHDRFNDSDQMPKSSVELVATYGYDIRSEDGPPRARRRRRYGRGPNKYTRNWEDENAYIKTNTPSGTVTGSSEVISAPGVSTMNYPRQKKTVKKRIEQQQQQKSRNKQLQHQPHQQQQNKFGKKTNNIPSLTTQQDRRQSSQDTDSAPLSSNNTENTGHNIKQYKHHHHRVESSSAREEEEQDDIDDEKDEEKNAEFERNNKYLEKMKRQPVAQHKLQQQQQLNIYQNNDLSKHHYTSQNRNNSSASGRQQNYHQPKSRENYNGFTSRSRLQRNLRHDNSGPKVLSSQSSKIHSQNTYQIQRNVDGSRTFNQSQNSNRYNRPEGSGGQHQNVSPDRGLDTKITNEMSKMSLRDVNKTHSIPPRMLNQQHESKGSAKRYSTLRQRALSVEIQSAQPQLLQQQQPTPQQQQVQTNYNHSGYYQSDYSQSPQQPQIIPQYTQYQGPPQPSYIQGPPQPPPSQVQQQPTILNYLPAQPQYPPQGPPPQQQQAFQGYQQTTQQFNPMSPADLYQPQPPPPTASSLLQPTGITYYSTDQQQITQRAVPVKRRNAIEIVAPPPLPPPIHQISTQSQIEGQTATSIIENNLN